MIGEYSVVTARRGALRARAEAGSKGARAALRLMDDPVRVISTVQVGITAIGILTGAVGEPVVRDLIGDWLPTWAAFVIGLTLITYLSVVFGELVPKALTIERAETLASLVAPPIELMSRVLRPVVWVLQSSAALLLRPFGITEVMAGESIRSADELRALVDEAEVSGVIPRAQEELLHNVFDFAGMEVRDIIVPSPDVAWLEASMTGEEALAVVVETSHERYPVGEETLDHLVGIVHFRDLLASRDARVRELARPAPVVPETKDLGALLRELREQRQQMAVVVDEYGGTAGIVTVHDVLEELVGELENEFDLPSSALHWVDDYTVEVAGSMTIDDFNETVGTTLPQHGQRTLAGLTFDLLGRRPVPGDVVEVDGVQIRVEGSTVCGSRNCGSCYLTVTSHLVFSAGSGPRSKVFSMTRVVVIDPQPAVRAGLAMMLRTEPGLVPVGVASGAHDGLELVARQRPDVVLLDPHLLEGDGLGTCRRLRALDHAPRVVLYTAGGDPTLAVTARVAGADGLVDKAAPAPELFEAIRRVARGESALPALGREELDAAAHKVDPEDLALLAMLVDRTEPADVAATLRLDGRRLGRRIERLLAPAAPAAPRPA